MNTALTPPLALLASVFILTLSHGLMVVLLPVHLGLKGVETDTIGLVLSLYALGMLLGGLYNNSLLKRAGHIRVFASAAALVAVSILACGLSADPILWGLMRLLNGFAISVALAVIDNWLSETATRETRGQLLAANQMVLTGGMFIGQFMFNLAPPEANTMFIVGGMLASLALVPMVLSRRTGPVVSDEASMGIKDVYRKSPLGMVGAFFSGLLVWSIFGMLPVYGAERGLEIFELTLLSGAAVLGSFLLQYPVGYLSDRYDRRTITACLIIISMVASAASPVALGIHLWCLLLMVALSTGVFSVLYALSISQTFDSLKQSEMGTAMGPLVMVYAAGAIFGPLLTSNAMNLMGVDALFYLLCLLQALFLGFIFYRIGQREALPVEHQEAMVVQSALAGAGIELDPRIEYNEAEQPLSAGADLAVMLAQSEPAAAIAMGADIVESNPSELLSMAYALAQVSGVDSKELMDEMSRVVPERRVELAETIAAAWPEGAADIVSWLLDEGADDAHHVIAGVAHAVPEIGADIIGAAIEQIAESDAEDSAVQEFVDNYVESVGERVDNLRPADRADDQSEEQLAEVYAVVAEALPEHSVDLAQSMTEAVPTAAPEVTEALVQAVTGDDDKYDVQASEAISQHMSNLADTVPEQVEDIAASIVEVVPEAAEDVDQALREWQSETDPTRDGGSK
ncbi:MAG: MFS transporter [Granulosicoccaceae bacterium]